MRHLSLCTAVLAVLILHALPTQAQQATPAANAKSFTEEARANDASNDRGIIASRADTLREGEFSINSYELFFLGATYGVTDDFQLSFTTLIPIVKDTPFVGSFNGKYVFYRNNKTVVSAGANLTILSTTETTSEFNPGTNTFDEAQENRVTAGFFGGSIQADHHLTDTFSVHGSATAQGVFGKYSTNDTEVGDGALITLSGGFTWRAGDLVKVMVEGFYPIAIVSGESDGAPFFLLNYGVRFYGKSLAVDLAFLRPVGEGFGGGDLPLGLPFVAFSARF